MSTPDSTPLTPLRLAFTYVGRSWRGVGVIMALTTATSALALVAPALVAAALAALDVGQGTGAAGTGGLDLNELGARVLRLWPFRMFNEPAALVVVVGVAYVGQALCSSALVYLTAITAVRVRSNILQNIQNDLVRHLLRQSLSFFNASRIGELVSRLSHDAQLASAGTGPAVQGLFQNTVQVAGLSVYLFSTNPWLTLGALGIVALHFTVNRVLRDPVKRASASIQNAQAHVSSTFFEMLSAARVIKSFGAEQMAQVRIKGSTELFRQTTRRAARVESVGEPARMALDALAVMGVLMVAALEVRAGRLNAQGFVLYVYVARVVIAPANALASSYLRLVGVGAALTRIAELLNRAPQVRDGVERVDRVERDVVFENVHFAYDEKPVLADVSLRIAKGDVVAVVGRSGAGKSTFTDLLLRLYDPQRGRILLDGRDVRDFTQSSYRRLFGVVSQDTLLLNDTVRNNIRFGRPEIDDGRIEDAARLAHAHSFIEALPLGYETLVGDRGVRLSGGERQRVAIARAIAHGPAILVLDEATSALDSESEREVQLAFERILQSATAVVVAHRLSTVLHADAIVFVDDGRIVDAGRHQELFDRCAPYRRLCELQFLDADV